MAALFDRLRAFLAELKRRRVYRVAVAYVAVAFVGLQAVNLLIPTTTVPSWTEPLLLALAIFGFPVALVLAWAFELTPEGIRVVPRAEPDRHGEPSAKADPGWPRRRKAYLGVASLFVVGAAAYAGVAVYSSGEGSGDAAPQIRRLAVLPLENLSGDAEQEYFSAGMTDALIDELARIGALTVISRTSAMRYEESDKSLPEIADELGVDGLIEGSVLRAGDRVRITLKLVHGPTDRQLWSRSYRRELREILSLQSDVARAVADEIQIALSPEEVARLSERQPVDPEAYKLWLRGNYQLIQLREPSFHMALDMYRRAAAIQPDYAPAHAGISMALIELGSWHASWSPREAFPAARESAIAALAMDSTVAEAHIATARIRQLFDRDWAGARSAYERGIALNPSATFARLLYANFLTAMGDDEETVNVGRRTIEFDPVSPLAYNELGFAHWVAGREEEALELYREGLEVDPEFEHSHGLLALLYVARGEREKGIVHAERFRSLQSGFSPHWLGLLGYIYGSAGAQAESRDILERLTQMREDPEVYVPSDAMALGNLGVDRPESAIDWLERGYEERDVGLVWLYQHPAYDALRSDPRFQELVRRLEFPDPSEGGAPTRVHDSVALGRPTAG